MQGYVRSEGVGDSKRATSDRKVRAQRRERKGRRTTPDLARGRLSIAERTRNEQRANGGLRRGEQANGVRSRVDKTNENELGTGSLSPLNALEIERAAPAGQGCPACRRLRTSRKGVSTYPDALSHAICQAAWFIVPAGLSVSSAAASARRGPPYTDLPAQQSSSRALPSGCRVRICPHRAGAANATPSGPGSISRNSSGIIASRTTIRIERAAGRNAQASQRTV